MNNLGKLGLSANQEKAYCTLLELGESTMTQLARSTNIKRPSMYLVIESLAMLGLVSETKKGKSHIIAPVHPRRLLQIATLRQKHIEETLPQLIATYNSPKHKPKILVFEGEEGVNTVYDLVFESQSRKHEALWFASISKLREHYKDGTSGYKKMLGKIRNPKIRELNFDDIEARSWATETAHFRKKYSQYEMRLLPNDFPLGATDMVIFEDKVAIFSLKGEMFVTVIESPEISKTHKALFEWAWRAGKNI